MAPTIGSKYYQEHREEILAQQKAYRQENKEKIKVRGKAYRQEHREEAKAHSKAYYQEHKEEKKAYNKAYGQEHKKERKAWQRQYHRKTTIKSLKGTTNSLRKKIKDLRGTIKTLQKEKNSLIRMQKMNIDTTAVQGRSWKEFYWHGYYQKNKERIKKYHKEYYRRYG